MKNIHGNIKNGTSSLLYFILKIKFSTRKYKKGKVYVYTAILMYVYTYMYCERMCNEENVFTTALLQDEFLTVADMPLTYVLV